MKPLYLNGRTGMTVALDEPALRVAAPGRAPTLYPLQRISRVIASGSVEWSTAALLACAERGITVTFLHADGAIHAYLFGESTQRAGLFCRLRDLLDRPDWRERYGDWYRAMESHARRALVKRLDLDLDKAPSAARLTALLDAHKQRYASPGICRFLDKRLRGLLAALVAELLAETGLAAEPARGLSDRLDLGRDLVGLLAWNLHLPVLELLSRGDQGHDQRLDDAELVRLFEAHSAKLRQVARGVLNRLHGWLAELG